ncbi:MAG TPA: hypothetical protein VMU25_00115 [Candidatus Paceibacterota bacterium]|nr:hypothetical protein [Candidatus Paceibacterota bacterium]
MSQISFNSEENDGFNQQRVRSGRSVSLPELVVRLSRGRITSERSAEFVLLGISVLALLLAGYLAFFAQPRVPTPPPSNHTHPPADWPAGT